MASLYKEYIKIGDNEVKFYIYFNRDTYSVSTSQPRKVGYTVCSVPVKRSKSGGFTMEESGAFTGFVDCLLEVDRQSKKRLEEAIRLLQENKEKYVAWYREKYGWQGEVTKSED